MKLINNIRHKGYLAYIYKNKIGFHADIFRNESLVTTIYQEGGSFVEIDKKVAQFLERGRNGSQNLHKM